MKDRIVPSGEACVSGFLYIDDDWSVLESPRLLTQRFLWRMPFLSKLSLLSATFRRDDATASPHDLRNNNGTIVPNLP